MRRRWNQIADQLDQLEEAPAEAVAAESTDATPAEATPPAEPVAQEPAAAAQVAEAHAHQSPIDPAFPHSVEGCAGIVLDRWTDCYGRGVRVVWQQCMTCGGRTAQADTPLPDKP